MEYSIKELSALSGVTPRTLRWYDEIGLLRPNRIAESGYRYYGPAQVDRLQDILFYRSIGFELNRIRAIVDDPSYNRMDALRSHLKGLREKRGELDRVIASVEETIRARERNEIMSDKKKFEAFKINAIEENEARYGKEIRAKYGDSFFLIPGYGAQGGKAEDIAQYLSAGNGGVVNSSRGVLLARKKQPGVAFDEAAYNECVNMKEAIANACKML